MDALRILGLSEGADKNAITKAYKKMALKHHPDKSTSPSSTLKLQHIHAAYELLMNGSSDPNSAETSDAYSAMSREDRRHVQMAAFKRWWESGCPDWAEEQKKWEMKKKSNGECPVCNGPCAVDGEAEGPVPAAQPASSGNADGDNGQTNTTQ